MLKDRIRIYADDYGRDAITTHAILRCFELGWIDTATLMVNTENSETAAQEAIQTGYGEKIGLHINLMEGRPLTSKILAEPSFCSAGCFNKQFMSPVHYKFKMSKSEVCALSNEIDAQMERFLAFGFTPKYLDSHCSTHNLLPVLHVVKASMRKYGFSSIRVARNINAKNNLIGTAYKMIVNIDIGASKMKQSDYFTSFRDIIARGRADKYKGRVELMTHPFVDDGKIVNLNSASFEEFFEYVKRQG